MTLVSGTTAPEQISIVHRAIPRESELTLWMVLDFLLQWIHLLVGFTIALPVIAVAYDLLQPREYVAEASFLGQEANSPQLGGLGQLAGQLGVSIPPSGSTSPDFYQQLVESNELLYGVATASYEIGTNRKSDLLDILRVNRTRPDVASATVAAMRRAVSVTVDHRTGLVRFEITMPQPALAVAVASAVLDQVQQYNVEKRHTRARREREFAEAAAAGAKADLASAESALSSFSERNRQWRGSPELSAQEARLERDITLRQTMYMTLMQNSETARVEEIRNTPVISILDTPAQFVAPKSRDVARTAFLAAVLGLSLAVVIAGSIEALRLSDGLRAGASPRLIAFRQRLLRGSEF